ncbi:cobalamin biosynthesis protein CobW [Alphaproteobacteria bacterium HT1-32]|nr:cobalamin biosynthesis protein CobW [Alphaproteobacteria bacterium HT1-32]|tara:strand:- start:15404 stop:16435 length:1032 start_codon:yes stop_codon:yes gene_type:complete
MNARIPATIVTGFLGAGKTTLIRHLLQNADGRRIALIINEFGDLGIDKGIVEGCGIPDCEEGDIVELANGCICCTVADDFLPTIETLLGRADPPDHIVIETSGLALPKPLIKAFAWPEVRSRTTVDGVVAMIDAAAVADGRFADDPAAVQAIRESDEMLDHDNPLEELFEDQLAAADIVILNKTDLLDEATIAGVEQTLKARLRPGVKILRATEGRVDVAVALGVNASAEDDLDARPSHHDGPHDHDHDDFDSFIVDLGQVDDVAALTTRIGTTVDQFDILRIKGFIDVPGKPMRQVIQGVGSRIQTYFDRPWKSGESRSSQLVVIGLAGMDKTAIEAALTAA